MRYYVMLQILEDCFAWVFLWDADLQITANYQNLGEYAGSNQTSVTPVRYLQYGFGVCV